MIKTKTVQHEELPEILREWLMAEGLDTNTAWELLFLQNEVVLRPKAGDESDLDAWWITFKAQYDDVLQQLASV